MTEIEVSIPIVRAFFAVEVLLRSPLLPLDIALLRSIGDGGRTIDRLSQEFSLSRRMIRASIIRLIEEDLLSANLATEELELSPRATAAHRNNELVALSYLGEPQQEQFSAVQELRWGTIIAGGKTLNGLRLGAPSKTAIRIPTEAVARSLFTLRSPEITAIYNARCAYSRHSAGDCVAVAGRLADRAGSTTLNLVLTAIKIGDVLDLWPIEHSLLWHRSDVAGFLAHLRRYCRALPELAGVFAQAGARSSQRATALPGRIHAATDMTARGQLEYLGESLDASEIGEHEETISELFTECSRVLDAGCHIVPMIDAANVAACKNAISSARSFCVIHSAFWSDPGIRQYADEIRAALSRGVIVYLLRGLDDQGGTLPSVLKELEQFAEKTPGTFYASSASHPSHAKIVVADADYAIVSSFNFLGATVTNPQLNVGLECRSEPKAQLPIGVTLIGNLAASGLSTPMVERLNETIQTERLSRTIGVASQIEAARVSTETMLNPRDWFEAHRGSVWREGRSPWELITDEEHREIMLRALHTAQRSIVVTSGDVTDSAADRTFCGYVAAAVKRGVQVTILWGTQSTDPVEAAAAAKVAEAIRGASKARPDLMKINEKPCSVHAKVLVIDDEVCIVSSFNFLSYRGTKAGGHEVGIKVYDPKLSASLRGLIESRLTDLSAMA